tara:strand:- start:10 stop:1173 length:1164 start_codon:yes stop_codon:yes gene_type:complete
MKNAFLNEQEVRKKLSQFILQCDRFSMGKLCHQFELEFANYQGSKHAVLFNSGSSANLAILQTYLNLGKLKKGDQVGFSALTWSTNAMPIIQLGMEPVPIDCDPSTLNCMSTNLRNSLKDFNLKAFFATNVLGFCGDLKNIQNLCDEKNILFIEDNCESLGTITNGKKTGSFGEAASFSFYVAHHMSTIEGGMVCTQDEEVDTMLRMVRAHGWDRNLPEKTRRTLHMKHKLESKFKANYTFYDLGYNLRPTEITGFLGLNQLQYLEKSNSYRHKTYKLLSETMQNNEDLRPPDYKHIDFLSCFATPVISRTNKLRDYYINRFQEAKIEIRPIIAGNIQNQPFFRKYIGSSHQLLGADHLDQNGFYCGLYPDITEEELQVIQSCLDRG